MTSPTPAAQPATPSAPLHSVRQHMLLPFAAYALMLASTSFIAGGIVHLGLGENTTFYVTLAAVGVVCFTAGNYLQEYVIHNNARGTGLARFLLVSFVLSIGIGMMTGGVQHYLDNPPYSTVLIPVGLTLAVTAFALREQLTLGHKFLHLAAGTVGVAALLFGGLSAFSARLDTPTGHAHGAQEQTTGSPAVTASPAPVVDAPSPVTPVATPERPVEAAPDNGHEDGHTDH
ncbi:hypothetical protein [Deinococcus aquaticus]|uniref:hypothetical protein n=1 Tax=Deinococcus aquaticus TaxID=328692 RepID=UPI003F487056